MWYVLTYFILFRAVLGDPDFKKCMEVNTFGYSYEALYRLKSKLSGEDTRIQFYVKAQSDAHILLTPNPNVLELASTFLAHVSRGSQVIEVLIGGGRNSFSEIRIGHLGGKRVSRAHESTPGILSADEYRGFWIHLEAEGLLRVGKVGNSTAFLVALPAPIEQALFRANYFGISTWNSIKGHWRINCPEINQTEIEEVVEEPFESGVQKLRRDLTLLYDPNMAPVVPATAGGAASQLTITIAMHVHHFAMDEKSGLMSVSGKIILSWNDWKLNWEASEYDNVTSFIVPATDIWTPQISTYLNRKKAIADLQMDGLSAGVLVEQHGNATWTPTFQLSLFCGLEVTNWPHDSHVCTVEVGYSEDMLTSQLRSGISLKAAPSTHWKTEGVSESEWKLAGVYFDEWWDINGSSITFSFEFYRKDAGYILVFYSPYYAVTAMILSALWLGPHHACQLHVACFSSLLLTLFWVNIADHIPPHSVNIPRIVSVYIWGLLLCTGSIVNYVFIKNLRLSTLSIPYWCRIILTNYYVQTIFHLPTNSMDSTMYNTLLGNKNQSKDWILVTAAIERIVFFVFFIVSVILWITL